jgi:hypothetical protein
MDVYVVCGRGISDMRTEDIKADNLLKKEQNERKKRKHEQKRILLGTWMLFFLCRLRKGLCDGPITRPGES